MLCSRCGGVLYSPSDEPERLKCFSCGRYGTSVEAPPEKKEITFGADPPTLKEKDDMVNVNLGSRVIEKKLCLVCEQEYQPSSNGQKYCLNCKGKKKAERDKKWRARKFGKGEETSTMAVQTPAKSINVGEGVKIPLSSPQCIHQGICKFFVPDPG